MKEIYDVTVPAWSLNYFINGVTDNLTDEEVEMLDEWWDGNFIEIIDPWNDEGEIETYFSPRNDITSLGDAVVDCKVILRDHYYIEDFLGIDRKYRTKAEALEALSKIENKENLKLYFVGNETKELKIH